ncbi:MAG: hypothetical protein GYA23_09275 [Methanomicrobiales archaeon]|nr:hypothetical protein [Methanomicrobiales archaeon]
MAVAEIIGAAVGIMLLVIVAYLLVGSTLTSAEVVITAQKDMSLQQDIRLNTRVEVTDTNIDENPYVNISVTNTGTQVISDFAHMDVLVYPNPAGGYEHLTYNANTCKVAGTWCIPADLGIQNDYIHPGQLDPDEKVWIMASPASVTVPGLIQVTTSNGITASRMLP